MQHNPEELWREALDSAREVCKNTQLAEDAACHAFNYVVTNLDNWDGRPIRNWVRVIAKNKALTLKRGIGRFVDYDIHVNDTATSPDSSDLDYSKLHRALTKLKPNNREVLQLHYFKQMDVRTIAESLELGESCIKARLVRARNELKQHL